MNSIRQIQELNKRQLEAGVSPEASWHRDYQDTAYIYIGGLPFELSEGDIITIFSQFGEPTFVNLVRDKETGKSKGFAFLKYEDQRSTELAVDNLGGTKIFGRMLRVDHTRYKKKDDGQLEDMESMEPDRTQTENNVPPRTRQSIEANDESMRTVLKEELELATLIREHDDDDPMKTFLIEEKQKGVIAARSEQEDSRHLGKKSHRRHRSHRPADVADGGRREHRSHHEHRDPYSKRSHSRDRSQGRARNNDGMKSRHIDHSFKSYD